MKAQTPSQLQSPSPGSESWLLALFMAIYAVSGLISMAVMNIAAGALGLAMVVIAVQWRTSLRAWANALSREARIYCWLSIALALGCLISLVYARINPLSYGGKSSAVHFGADLAKLWYFAWPLALASALRALKSNQRYAVVASWLIAFGLLSGMGVVQYFTGWPRAQVIPELGNRFHAILFLGHHLSVASIFIFPFFVALSLWIEKAGASAIRLRRSLLGLICFFGLLTLFLTYSRMLWVALPLGLILGAVWLLPRRWAGAVLAAGAVGLVGLAQTPSVHTRIHSPLGFGERSDLWRANWDFFLARPITGVGFRHNIELSAYYLSEKLHSTDVFIGHAHNNLLDMLGTTGILGTIPFLLWCLYPFWLAWKYSSRAALEPAERAIFKGLVVAWFVFQINGITQVNFWEAKVQHQWAWMMAWLLCLSGVSNLKRDELA